MFYSMENRARIVGENPDATFGDIGKKIGAAWTELDAKEKAQYNQLAADDKIRAAAEKSAAE